MFGSIHFFYTFKTLKKQTMKSFNFDKNSSLFIANKKFMVLGIEDRLKTSRVKRKVKAKLRNRYSKKIKESWGTLGWANDDNFLLNGPISFSELGNKNEGQSGEFVNEITARHTTDIHAINPEMDKRDKVTERVINFDEVKFDLPETFTLDEIPKLRLNLFVNENEGAIVYYQHSARENNNDKDALIEYIQCEKTDDTFSSKRDRLNYFFDIIPENQLEVVDEEKGLFRVGDQPNLTSFIIKILSFKRKKLNALDIIDEVTDTINENTNPIFAAGETLLYDKVGKEKYQFLVFNPNMSLDYTHKKVTYKMGGAFLPVDDFNKIDNTLKTLFIIHGTFVSTVESYLDVWRIYDGESNSLLQRLIKEGQFEQIIALDHPTISQGAEANVAYLKAQLSKFNIQFHKPVDVITSSRGALLAEWIGSDAELNGILNIGKVMMFSAANGSGYFRTAKYISKGLSIWRKNASGITGKVILGFLQLSADFFVSLPGCTDMTPLDVEGSTLEKYLNGTPNNPIVYKTVISDWDKSLEDKFLAKAWKTPLDFLIRLALGKRHDWVIGTDAQALIPYKSIPFQAQSLHLRSIHGGYMDPDYAQYSDGSKSDIHTDILNFFKPNSNDSEVELLAELN